MIVVRNFKSALKQDTQDAAFNGGKFVFRTEKGFGPKQPKLVWPGLACIVVTY